MLALLALVVLVAVVGCTPVSSDAEPGGQPGPDVVEDESPTPDFSYLTGSWTVTTELASIDNAEMTAGARRDSIVVSKPQGARPGGTAAIGSVVDTDLQTRVEGLVVADASVLPETPGMPPMVTIGALAGRLGRTLA